MWQSQIFIYHILCMLCVCDTKFIVIKLFIFFIVSSSPSFSLSLSLSLPLSLVRRAKQNKFILFLLYRNPGRLMMCTQRAEQRLHSFVLRSLYMHRIRSVSHRMTDFCLMEYIVQQSHFTNRHYSKSIVKSVWFSFSYKYNIVMSWKCYYAWQHCHVSIWIFFG